MHCQGRVIEHLTSDHRILYCDRCGWEHREPRDEDGGRSGYPIVPTQVQSVSPGWQSPMPPGGAQLRPLQQPCVVEHDWPSCEQGGGSRSGGRVKRSGGGG
jgi:hypothetical protein